jgi:hypothetical protein
MADAPATPAPPQKVTPLTHTTKRGFATASFVLGLWGSLTFWWYPFGMMVAGLATLFSLICIVMGWRAGKEGQHLAWLGLLFGMNGVGAAITCYRVVQLVYEETPPPIVSVWWPF